MKSLLLIASSGIAAGGLYAGGAFTPGEVYDLPIAEARSRLATLPVSPMVGVTAGGSDAADTDVDVGSEKVVWKVSVRSGKPARFTAKLEAEGAARTRVTLDYSNGRIDGGYADRLLSTSFMRSYAEAMFAEEVDARLEGRSADQGQALHEFARRAAENPEQVRELGLVTESMFRDVAKQVHENAKASGELRQQSTRESMKAATRPTLVLPKQDSRRGH